MTVLMSAIFAIMSLGRGAPECPALEQQEPHDCTAWAACLLSRVKDMVVYYALCSRLMDMVGYCVSRHLL